MNTSTADDRVEPAESARELQASYVMCRTVRHAWYPYTDNTLPTVIQGQRISLVCDRCGMTRHDVRTRNGYLLHRQYVPPKDYSLSREVTADNLWEEYLLRTASGEIALRRVPRRPAALQKSRPKIENDKPYPPRREDSSVEEREFRARSGR